MDVPDETATVLDGRYEVGPLVGVGGTAQVHRAWDRERGCAVAVKVFRSGAAPTPGYGGARELQVLAGVRHPGLVGVHGAGVDPQGRPFVVMDLVEGLSLSARLDDGPLPAAAVAGLGAVLAAALDVVHARGVVHRDVKPANVLLDTDGRPWLTDFGIARIVDATQVTATGIVVGTAAYMAPEQVRGEAVGPAADVYALGLVLLEAVTGRREYEGGAVESALARLHRAPQVPATVPDLLAATVRAMTATVPADRPTAREVAVVLGAPAVGSRRPAARRLAVPVAALAALVVAAFTGAVSLVGGPSDDARLPAAVRAAAPAPALAVPPQLPLVPDLSGAAGAAVAAMGAAPPVDAAAPVPVALTHPDAAPVPAATARPVTGDGTADHHAARGDDRDAADRPGGRGDATATKRPKNDAAEKDKKADKPEKGDDGGGKGDSGTSGKGDSGSSGGGDNGGGSSGGGGGKGGGRSGSNSGKG